MRSDNEIKRDVEGELQWDPDLDAADIAVTVKRGVVALTGFARSLRQRRQAEAAVKRVAGVLGVANDVEVRWPIIHARPDPEIARDIVSQLQDVLPSSWEQVRVLVQSGSVTLEGKVEWHYQRENIESAALGVRGVKTVTNLVEIKSHSEPSNLKQEIESAFLRSAEINAHRITVEVEGGQIILSGIVSSWAEREEAERTAWRAPGVTQVENRIVIGA
jgi:osmotically-inducible protein OsmY